MDIEDFTAKLICEYREKEEACDLKITTLQAKNRALRREGKELADRMEVLAELRVLEAQKVAYVQARMDILSIQDHLGIG